MPVVNFLLEGEPVIIDMASALTSLGTVITQVMSIIEGNTILLAMFVVPLMGAGIGLVKRLV